MLKLLPLIAFAVPMLWLYLLEPATFEAMWKGRTFQLFFIWLISLELILDWENLRPISAKSFSIRSVILGFSVVLPSLYVAASYYGGLNAAILSWSTQNRIQWANSMALSSEYFAFAALFVAIVYLAFGVKGLKAFSVPAFFLVLVGAFYTADNVFPYGQFTPFQIFVPTTTSLASAILNLMGYSTSISYLQEMPQLTAVNSQGASATFSIAWPCAGIESFLIFTVVILLFLKRMSTPMKVKVGYFAFGAAVTYIINAFRIVNIFTTAMVYGETSYEVQNVHNYVGPLFAITWIVAYPIIILMSQSAWTKIRRTKSATAELQQSLPNPA
jgi:thaumarchaeosortase